MQQGDPFPLLPGSSPQLSTQDYYDPLTQHGDGTHADTSYPTYQGTTTQGPFNPYGAYNTAVGASGGGTQTMDKIYCDWPGCRQFRKEFTAGEFKFVRPTHICPRSRH
jgi:hypothetical protein